MQFAQPIWLAGGVLACALLAWSWRRFDAGQRAALAKFAAARLLPKLTTSISPVRRRLKRGLMLAGVALLFTALARPQSGFEMRETHRRGLELVFAVDTSKSMLAQDVKPDRLTRARLGVTDLLDRLQGDGVGLIAFAGTAFLQCPVTLDYNAFRESLNALDTGTIPAGGTNIAGAIREAEAVFEERGASEKILVLMTDGEDLDGDGITAAEAAGKKGVKIFTVGVGSGNGELVPVPSANGGTEFARDAKGQLVKSQLDETVLKKIAEVSGGMYQPLGAQGGGLNTIYDQGLAGFKRGDLSSRETKVPLERFQWPLAAALLCLMADWMIGDRRRAAAVPAEPVVSSAETVRKAPVTSPARAAVGAGAAVAVVLTVLTPPGARAATPQSAEQAYQKGDYSQAHQDYAATAAKEPGRPELQFNTGSAAYKAGDYSQAVAGFQ
ncbi:MAG: VWA domain-containing protein, partial [Verrucomicrobiaceae bacterium]